MAAIGLAFQMPLGLLGLQRAGVINGSTLTRHWRYATVIIAVIAAAMPGADPVTTGAGDRPARHPLPRQHRVAQDRRPP